METFYQSGKAILGFLVIVLIFSMATNQSTTEKMVLLVLLGTLLFNTQTFVNFLKDF